MQAQVDPAALGGSPRHALRRVEPDPQPSRTFAPRRVQFVDNLSDSLTEPPATRSTREALYIMLAVPGALVGLGLAYLAALGAVDRDRRDLALLARAARRGGACSASPPSRAS